MKMPLSKELENVINANFNKGGNVNLLLTKYVREWGTNWQHESKEKGTHMEKVKGANIDKKTYEDFFKRWKRVLMDNAMTQIEGSILWRLVVGLGSGSVLETSMTLHHIFGVPYIPGSALKGMLRHYYINRDLDKYNTQWDSPDPKDENNKRKYKNLEAFLEATDAHFIKLFGNQKQKGGIIFMDAYPTVFPQFETDVMNPHFSKYYSEGAAPADWLSPVPVKFLTVGKDTKFIFAFKADDELTRKVVSELIIEALSDSGVGAKTAVGYGYFRQLKDVTPVPSPATEPDIAINEANPAKSSDSKAQGPTEKLAERPQQPLAKYQKSSTELKDEFLNTDGTMKTEEEYKKFIESTGKQFKKDNQQTYEKAKKWYEKNK